MSLLNKLTSIRKSLPKRVGRGYGSGKGGHNSGRGQKGQNSRRGGGVAIWFEGGQLPLIKRMPMQRGKSKLNVVRPTAQLNLTELNNVKADIITLDTLKLEKVIDARFKKAKIISSGEITRKVTVEGIGVTEGAKTAIEKAGGKVL
ncbi:MAG: 50S ribosomal protein L15 [Candidatus Pacebacteria bacterium]|nr:50S ribosomal protein L15 [Candidatus Paceibacterota bacterium]